MKKRHNISRIHFSRAAFSNYATFSGYGEAQQSLGFEYRVGNSTVCNKIFETSKATYECLKEEYLRAPSKKDEWLSISKDFEDIWNIPHCLGVIDGKLISLQSPKVSGVITATIRDFIVLCC